MSGSERVGQSEAGGGKRGSLRPWLPGCGGQAGQLCDIVRQAAECSSGAQGDGLLRDTNSGADFVQALVEVKENIEV